MTTTTAAAPRTLAGGLELRQATDADIDAIVIRNSDAFGGPDVPLVTAFLTGPGASVDNWLVVTDGPKLVAACALLDVALRLDGLPLPCGQVEYVSTDPDYQRRGLIRTLFDEQHVRSAARGHVLQLVGGIPYFYRKFDYGYGVSYPELYDLSGVAPAMPADRRVREATSDDVDTLLALDATRSTAGLQVQRDETSWRFELHVTAMCETPPHRTVIVEARDGDGWTPVAWGSIAIGQDEQMVFVMHSDTPDVEATDAVLARAGELTPEGWRLFGHDQPGTVMGDRVRALGTHEPYGLGVYVRIPDPAAMLEAIRPVLSARLAASSFADATGTLPISLYRTGVELDHAGGEITAIRTVAGIEDPWDDRGCGVAPDWFPALVLGRWGAVELERRIDDVSLGQHRDLLEVLFPQIPTDLVTDV